MLRMLKLVGLGTLIGLTYLAAASASAQNPPNDAEFAAALEKFSGVTIKRRQQETGSERPTDPAPDVVEYKRAGVTITATTTKGKTTWFGRDSTKNGAVLCLHMILIAIEPLIDVCQPGDNADKHTAINDAIGVIHDFVADNSVVPVTRKDLDEQRATKSKREAWDQPSATPESESCKLANAVSQGILDGGSTIESRLTAFRTRLGPPRWPVANPCL